MSGTLPSIDDTPCDPRTDLGSPVEPSTLVQLGGEFAAHLCGGGGLYRMRELPSTLGVLAVNRRPKRTPFVEQRDGYDGCTVRAGCGVGRA